MTPIVRSSEYESPALAWLYREIARLDERMLDGGIPDEDTRRLICANYFFDIGEGLSEEVTTFEGKQYTPGLLFTSGDTHLATSESFDFHEYALSIVDEYYASQDRRLEPARRRQGRGEPLVMLNSRVVLRQVGGWNDEGFVLCDSGAASADFTVSEDVISATVNGLRGRIAPEGTFELWFGVDTPQLILIHESTLTCASGRLEVRRDDWSDGGAVSTEPTRIRVFANTLSVEPTGVLAMLDYPTN